MIDINQELANAAKETNEVKVTTEQTTNGGTDNLILTDTPQPKDITVENLLGSIDEAVEASSNDFTAKLAAGTYKAVTNSLEFKTTEQGYRILEISYDVFDESGAEHLGTFYDPNSFLPETFPVDNVTKDEEKRKKSQTRNNMIIARLVKYIENVLSVDYDTAKSQLAQWIVKFLNDGKANFTNIVKEKEGTLQVVHKKTPYKGDDPDKKGIVYDNYKYTFTKKNV